MKQIQGLCWPDDVGTKWAHSFKHVRSLEWAVCRCRQRRTAVQAGGNIGLWPRRLAEDFDRVITFEPDAISRECLRLNVPASVEVHSQALGAVPGVCGLERESLGSHHVVLKGTGVDVTTVDSLGLSDLDLLQLDIEGYEYHALFGAIETLIRCRPVVQVEMRGFSARYYAGDDDILRLLARLGYLEVSRQPGNDVVFEVPQ